MSHTTGPWSWWTSNSHKRLTAEGQQDGGVLHASGPAGWPTVVVSEADARLIAAAPDLLAALRIAAGFMKIASDWNIDEAEINGEMKSTCDWLDIVRAAIAKATGEKQ